MYIIQTDTQTDTHTYIRDRIVPFGVSEAPTGVSNGVCILYTADVAVATVGAVG